ncbi:MAG: hypothetical protein ABIF09_15550 [Gemmatimonadota bacterium]
MHGEQGRLVPPRAARSVPFIVGRWLTTVLAGLLFWAGPPLDLVLHPTTDLVRLVEAQKKKKKKKKKKKRSSRASSSANTEEEADPAEEETESDPAPSDDAPAVSSPPVGGEWTFDVEDVTGGAAKAAPALDPNDPPNDPEDSPDSSPKGTAARDDEDAPEKGPASVADPETGGVEVSEKPLAAKTPSSAQDVGKKHPVSEGTKKPDPEPVVPTGEQEGAGDPTTEPEPKPGPEPGKGPEQPAADDGNTGLKTLKIQVY